MVLYYGSHGGISGSINSHSSRSLCDFGTGFYTGDLLEQAEAPISDDENGILYILNADLTGLRVYDFTDDLLWALYVGVNRGRINTEGYSILADIVNNISSYDVVSGLIADDRMMFIYNEFINGNITDTALTECLKYVKLGRQYVFKNDKACSCIRITDSYRIGEERKHELKHSKSVIIGSLPDKVNEIRRKYRCTGLYVDEILERYR